MRKKLNMTSGKLKNSLMLFLFFVKIGCFTFGGGWSILAQMEQEFVDRKKILTKEELLDMVAVGRSLPGIMITNISMLFGYRFGGWIGGFCAVFGITFPAVAILSIVTVFYTALKDNHWMYAALRGIRAAVVPIIGSAALSLGKEVFKTRKGCIICAVAFLLYMFTDMGNITMIAAGVVLALVWRGGKQIW
ncbi:MAG: chromate transporter [Lachnospiraceae bacterium]|nr:chromate transporter [Lachnospiraceae bacterium]